ncbi:MAG TPA: long-chain fatty acid--CoA ligase [Actinomycetota bacterium]|nr:long-chain fatty acid--CoA ligase [Actinomycetota bacterium]
MDLSRLLRSAASDAGPKTALVVASGGDKISFAELDREADRVARGLASAGVGPGDRVALGMHNVPHFVYAYFGILRAGAVVVPLNVMLTEDEAGRIMHDAQAKAALIAPPFAQTVEAAASDTDTKIFSTSDWDALGDLGDPAPDPDVDEDSLAVLAYTSGTTGEPKGAMLSHGNLLANLSQQMSIPDMHVTEDDVLFLALPLFHIFGLNVTLGLLVMNHAKGLLVDKFEPVPALELIQKYKVTVLFGAPPMYTAWSATPGADQYDLSSVRMAISGAAPLPADVLREFRDIFGVQIYEGYGLTETAPTLCSNRMTERPKPGSVGKPLPGIDLRVVDESGTDVEIGDPGEIVVKGPNVFQGYWNKDDATRQVFRDGWFRTGDIAVQDEEGYLYLVDRKRDLIIVSGFNVFPSEVESALLQNPAVAEAAVIGQPHPYTGETVKAFVVLEPGVEATPEELLDDVQTRLARFKCPTSLEIVDSLPHLLTGKVLRRALRAG